MFLLVFMNTTLAGAEDGCILMESADMILQEDGVSGILLEQITAVVNISEKQFLAGLNVGVKCVISIPAVTNGIDIQFVSLADWIADGRTVTMRLEKMPGNILIVGVDVSVGSLGRNGLLPIFGAGFDGYNGLVNLTIIPSAPLTLGMIVTKF